MNPFKFFIIYSKVNGIFNLFKETSVSKSLFLSKTFWVNILTAGIDLMGVLPIPSGWSVPTLAVINIILRMLTDKAVHIISPE